MKINRLDVPKAMVGESPVWDAAGQALFWIDILGCAVWRYHPETLAVQSWSLPSPAGSMVLRQGGGALVALADGVYTLDFTSGACSWLAGSPLLHEGLVLADGKVDRSGRFIVGSSDRSMREPLGMLFALDPGASELRMIDKDIILANGPCWSPDNATFYHADSVRQIIYAYDYDLDSGKVGSRRVFATTHDLGGIPDGATVDASGFLWSAICEGSKLVRFDPDGQIDRIVDFPQKLPGSVTFGGLGFDELFVPTLSPAFLGREADPFDGSMFIIEELGVTGLPEPKFAA